MLAGSKLALGHDMSSVALEKRHSNGAWENQRCYFIGDDLRPVPSPNPIFRTVSIALNKLSHTMKDDVASE